MRANAPEQPATPAKRDAGDPEGAPSSAKRVRFSPTVEEAGVAALYDESGSGSEAEEEEGVPAADVVRLHFFGGDGAPAKPLFTHQIFECDALPLGSAVRLAWGPDLRAEVQQGTPSALLSRLEAGLPPADARGPSAGPAPVVGEPLWSEGGFEARLSGLAGDAAAQALFARAEPIAMWMIDAASPIDAEDPRWQVLWLYSVPEGGPRAVAGYMTLFTFTNPFSKHGGVESLRVCQALVLPPFQRRGLGARMLQTVYDVAAAREAVGQVTVEDPAEGFARLRDVVDARRYRLPAGGLAPGDTAAVEAAAAAAARELMIVPAQARRCVELALLQRVPDGDEEALKAFRLMVKRRLNKQYKHELAGVDAAERKAKLAAMFEEDYGYYRGLLGSVGSLGSPGAGAGAGAAGSGDA